jgi:hypothetical protein
MPTRTIDDDPYASMADPTEGTSTKRGAPRSAAEQDNSDPYAGLADPTKTMEGVRIEGTNAAGQPIYAPAGSPEPRGSATRRFLSSAVSALKEGTLDAAKGLYHAATDPARAPDEEGLNGIDLFFRRTVADPAKSEAKKAGEEFAQSDPWSLHPSHEARWHRQLAVGHGLAAALPMVGPAAAQAGEKIGTQFGTGDVAGGLGTLAGNVAMYAAPEALGKVAKSRFVSRTIPHGQITRLIRPMAGDLKFGKDPAAAILSEGITANTLEDLGNKVSDRLTSVGKQLDAEARKYPNKTVDLRTALKPLDNAMSEAAKSGDRSLFTKLHEIKTELTLNWKPFRTAKGEVILRPTGIRNLRMNPADALAFKRIVGDRIRWSEDPLTGEANKALGAVYGQVKDATNAAVPGLKELNEKYSDLVGAAKSIQRRLPVEARNAHWSLSDIALGAHSLPLAITRHIARTPAVRTRTAAGLYNLPRIVPKRPSLIAAPPIAAAQSAQRLRELQDEAARRAPSPAP